MGQRFGMGISSRKPLVMFSFGIPTDGEEDNQLLLAREVFDLPNYPICLGRTEPLSRMRIV